MDANDAPPKSRWQWNLSCDNGTMWPNPQRVAEVELELRYGSPRSVRFLAASVCEAYLVLVSHPAGTEAMVKKLRSIRRAVLLEQPAAGAPPGGRREGRVDEDLEQLAASAPPGGRREGRVDEDLEQPAAGAPPGGRREGRVDEDLEQPAAGGGPLATRRGTR